MNYKILEYSRQGIATDCQNDGKTIVFLHGWGANASAFLFVAKRLKSLGYTCILPDFAGFGKTPEPDFAYTVKDYANDVLALLKELGIKSAIFVCHSFGGRVGIELAAHHKAVVKKLVLVDSAGCRPKRRLKYWFRVILHKILKECGLKGLKGSSDYRMLSPVMKQTFKNVVNYFQDDDLLEIDSETAIFWGKDDKDTPAFMARKMAKRIKNSSLFWLDGGHFAYATDFEKFFAVLSAFLRG